jgi:antitoxin component YwqK of YwqJK toxin-antitoxin module
MKKKILEYYPNGWLKHEITFHPNGRKFRECFYNKNRYYHNKLNNPAYQEWYDNGCKSYVSYFVNGCRHNIYNPARIWYTQFGGKINQKEYYINDFDLDNKLNWRKQIKNI